MLNRIFDHWCTAAAVVGLITAMCGCISMDEMQRMSVQSSFRSQNGNNPANPNLKIDETQWTTVSGSVRSQYGNHPAYTNLKDYGSFMEGKTYSVFATLEHCTLESAYARLIALINKSENDGAFKDLLHTENAQAGADACEVNIFQKSSPSSTTMGIRTRYNLRSAGNGVVLSITSKFSPGLFARTDDVIRDYADTIDNITGSHGLVTSNCQPLPPTTVPHAAVVTLDVDTELGKMVSKFADGLHTRKVVKVAVIDVLDVHGRKSELGRSLEEKIQISLLEKMIKVIDRNNIQAILDEHKMSRTGLCNPEDAKKFGQISGADALILGTITMRDDKYVVMVKAISTETAEVVAADKCIFSNSIDLEKMANTEVKQ